MFKTQQPLKLDKKTRINFELLEIKINFDIYLTKIKTNITR